MSGGPKADLLASVPELILVESRALLDDAEALATASYEIARRIDEVLGAFNLYVRQAGLTTEDRERLWGSLDADAAWDIVSMIGGWYQAIGDIPFSTGGVLQRVKEARSQPALPS